MSNLIKCAVATFLASLAISIPAKEARAASPALCNIFDVEFNATPFSDLIIHCSGDTVGYSAWYAAHAGECPVLRPCSVVGANECDDLES